MNLKAVKIEEFGAFSQFESLKEFNHHIEQWMLVHKDAFSKGGLVALKRLIRYSAKIPGVCNTKIGTLLKAIHEEYNGNGISEYLEAQNVKNPQALGGFCLWVNLSFLLLHFT